MGVVVSSLIVRGVKLYVADGGILRGRSESSPVSSSNDGVTYGM